MDGFQFSLVVVLVVGFLVACIICAPILVYFGAVVYGLLTGV